MHVEGPQWMYVCKKEEISALWVNEERELDTCMHLCVYVCVHVCVCVCVCARVVRRKRNVQPITMM